ncbi:hypothetical protein C8R43DRAFT_858013, partial [Mycena crocata]
KNSIPALHRLLANAETYHWSAKKIGEQCRLAKEGKYTARNYTQYELDLTVLLYELGGGGAVYAMNHSIFALPSRNTIQPYRRQHSLVPSVNGVQISDISQNITALFGSHTRRDTDDSGASMDGPLTTHLHTLSFDELATERKIDYMSETDEMGGLCLEHVSALETVKVGDDLQAVEKAVAAVKDGTVHISHETYRHETSVGAISRLSETGYGAKPVFMGPSCKKGSVMDCLRTMEMVLEAWKRSPDGESRHGPVKSIATDGDHKRRLALFMMCMHDEIRDGNPLWPFVKNLPGLNLRICSLMYLGWCTLLCSLEGLALKSVCINRDLLLSWLERLPDHDWSETSIHNLLHPSDAQNVSRAIKLLLCIIELSKLDPGEFDPSEAAEFEALCLLAEALDALLQPFINTELSLSEQVESLIKASHLLCALYVQNGTSFMSNQLYADLQAMIKNAILMVPKTCIINGQLKVFICLLGDDVLEALFGRSRMIGGHSPNCSVGELRDRFGSAMNLDYIYEHHPELERQPRRLNMFRMRHVDHLRPSHFTRELRADSVDLEARWVAAVKATEAILAKYGVRMAMSFAERFKQKDTDLMRPLGGKYPAISADVDRSMSNSTTATETIDPSIVNAANLLAGVDFDRIIASENQNSSSSPFIHSLFAKIDASGNLAHKKTILRTLFDMTQDSHGSHDSTHFHLGNLFATVLHNTPVWPCIGLALAKCTLIKRVASGARAVSISAIPHGELHLPESPYMISGQVLSLVPLPRNPDRQGWVWDGEFISFSLTKKKPNLGEQVSRLKNLQFTVSSRLIEGIHEKACETLTSETDIVCTHERTWAFKDADLRSTWEILWNRLVGDKPLHQMFPLFTGVSEALPGTCYANPIAKTAIEQSLRDRNTCRVCRKPVKDTDRQMHVGEHIIKFMCRVDDIVENSVSNAYPCGTCAGPTVGGACKIGIKGGKADSECPAAYSFLISSAGKFKESRPCTNVPIPCPLDCSETHWKYNFQRHLDDRHPQWKQVLSPSFIEKLQISRAEHLALKIPAEKIIEWPPDDLPA